MSMKIIILNTPQFGTLTDSYKWCEYLKDDYNIVFLCFDSHLKKMDLPGVNYVYIHRFDSPLLRGLWYIIYTLFYCLFHKGFIFIVYFKFCQIFPIVFFWRDVHVDVRTLSVSTDKIRNARNDQKLLDAVNRFRSCSFISNGLLKKIKPSCARQFVLPLGADVISKTTKEWNSLRLLYVGTFNNRKMIKTIIGFEKYIKLSNDKKSTYTLVGDGEELQDIISYINQNGLNNINVVGRKSYDELKQYFDECNVGVSFVPIEDCYQYQPPTKTFEYVLSGLFCIATKTEANKEIINKDNGILILDTSDDFYKSLKYISSIKHTLCSSMIRETLKKNYTWESVVDAYLKPILAAESNT